MILPTLKKLSGFVRHPRWRWTLARATAWPQNHCALSGGFHLVLPSTGGGNIGDTALLESLLEHAPRPLVVMVRTADDYPGLGESDASISVVSLPGLVYGGLSAFFLDCRRYLRLLDRACSFTVIGADVMDGAYNWKASVNRSYAAVAAAKRGVASRVLGFSWNRRPNRHARDALARAGRAGVELYARDPQSFARLQHDGVTGVRLAADTVFLLSGSEPVQDETLVGGIAAADRLVLVNASAMLHHSDADYECTRHLLRDILDRGFTVLLTPHVSRPTGDDIATCQRLADRVSHPRLIVIRELLTPTQIRSLAEQAEFVFTGRMHLAILALASGTPVIAVDSQDKVTGLGEMFGGGCVVVQADASLQTTVLEAIANFDGRADELAGLVCARLGGVRERARLNFSGFTDG